jgi:serine/threonine protein kinase
LPLSKDQLIEGERGVYKLERKISEGGMGLIWAAKSPRNDRHFVVKEPHARGSDEQIAIKRLRFESDILRYLNDESKIGTIHANQLITSHVVRYVDSAEISGQPLLIVEFIEGSSLSTAFKQPMPENACLIQVSILLNVVMALHKKGFVHRDISAGNILLNPERGMVLIDFGTCRLSRKIPGIRNPGKGEMIFKRGFSAPELLHGRSNERSDIFSVGAIMFLLLTGKNPANFMSGSQFLQRAACELNQNVSRQASGIIQAAMSPDPRTRFVSPSQMLTAIEDLRKPIAISTASIAFGHTHFPITPPFTEIGRQHVRDKGCKSLGFSSPPSVLLADPRKIIEKHRARIWGVNEDRYLIEDLRSTNGTAVKSGTAQFQALSPPERTALHNSDIVALAYKPNRGPYITFEFKR